MNKTRIYYQPFGYSIDGANVVYGNIPSELYSFQAFASREKCIKWLENKGYNPNEFFIQGYIDDDIENVTILDEFGNVIEVNNEPSIEDYADTPTSDLFAIVADKCSKETILSVAEGFVGCNDTEIREFLFACLGFSIE